MSDKNYVKLDEQSLIFHQLNRLNALLTTERVPEDIKAQSEFSQRLKTAISSLESLVSPLIDDDYIKERKEVREGLDEEYASEKPSTASNYHSSPNPAHDKAQRVSRRKAYALKMYGAIIMLLHRNNIYFAESEEYIID